MRRIFFHLAMATLGSMATATESPEPKPTECACREPANGARPGETLDQRAIRTEREWRLTQGEIRVNKPKRRPK